MLLCQSRHIQTETTHADSHRGKALCLWHLQCQVCPSLSELLLDWGWLCFFPSRFAVMGTVQVQCGRDLGLHQSVSQSVLSLYGALSLWRLILAHGVCGREVLFKVLGIESYTCTVIGLFQCIVSALLLLCVWYSPCVCWIISLYAVHQNSSAPVTQELGVCHLRRPKHLDFLFCPCAAPSLWNFLLPESRHVQPTTAFKLLWRFICLKPVAASKLYILSSLF